jgi:hypothetical protein
MTSKRKQVLIYECASEAVMQARIEIMKNIEAHDLGRHPVVREIDCVLSKAQHKAGQWAVDASCADTRTVRRRDITT